MTGGNTARHFLHRIDQQRSRLWNSRFSGAVHGDDQLIGIFAGTEAPHRLLGARRRLRQRYAHLRVVEEAARPAERIDRGVATLLERRAHRARRVGGADVIELRERRAAGQRQGQHCDAHSGLHAGGDYGRKETRQWRVFRTETN